MKVTKPNSFLNDCGINREYRESLTKREYFAAIIMQAFCSTGDYYNMKPYLSDRAKIAVEAADKLIEELNKGED